ncbi:hypothetical protein [Chryseobacterium sp. EO14]|uniref:hypothetical protein n=1 Tax=Chryseobacterium sp. EO14 TaxID=2950551 RepID=UPI00210E07ED|nr:hypothetical protein [Chryseobacterium sp. EO14]MCQ4141603.1 hypothetical protein [Chryseobacterium sp. EO14]
MKNDEHTVRIILLDYLTSDTRHDFIRRLQLEFSQAQCQMLIEKLESYTALCHGNSFLLSFPYLWDKIKQQAISMTKEEVAELLWNKEYLKQGVSKKQLGKICFSWFLFEKQLLEFRKEKLPQVLKNKQQNIDAEHDR